MNIKDRIEYLRDEINSHNHAYYILDKPTISDFNFDKLLSELISLEEKNPDYFNINSPSQKGWRFCFKMDLIQLNISIQCFL